MTVTELKFKLTKDEAEALVKRVRAETELTGVEAFRRGRYYAVQGWDGAADATHVFVSASAFDCFHGRDPERPARLEREYKLSYRKRELDRQRDAIHAEGKSIV